MGFLDRLFGGSDERAAQPARPVPPTRQLSEDELAVERYRYLLRTAPPESIEAVHAEAFAKLTPQQRAEVYRTLAEQAPPGERITSDDPAALARAATRAEMRSPGTMERSFSGGRGGMGGPSMGSMFAGSLLGTIAGVVVGSAIAQAFLPDPSSVDTAGGEGGDAGTDAGADAGSADASGAEAGGYDGGGDYGGGDFGGGDFGGDFGF